MKILSALLLILLISSCSSSNFEGRTLRSGLKFKVLRQGSGRRPKSSSRVTVHYRGTFLNGKVFDSSYDRGQPATFPLNGVIRGWTQGLQMMQEGAKFRFMIPPHLAYGRSGRAEIPANSTLFFDVELLKVHP